MLYTVYCNASNRYCVRCAAYLQDKLHSWPLLFSASSPGYDTLQYYSYVVLEGVVTNDANTPLIVPARIPMMVLRDPPGSLSSASLATTVTFTGSLSRITSEAKECWPNESVTKNTIAVSRQHRVAPDSTAYAPVSTHLTLAST